MSEVRDMFLATQRKPLEVMEPWPWLRWLLRRYFQWRGFACRSHVCDNPNEHHAGGRSVHCPECGTPVVVLCDGKCYASIEYRGVYDDDAAARWAANCAGGEIKPIPFNAVLSEQTTTYKTSDVPHSEASPWYRRGVMLPFVTLTRSEVEQLGKKIDQTVDCAEGKCTPKTV